MGDFTIRYVVWAVLLGSISAVSLPLGSALGLLTKPRPIYMSVLAAFGAGALIAALSIELVAPTVLALGESDISQESIAYTNFYALVTGAGIGGVLFTLLDQLLNSRGGFLRRTTATIAYLSARKRDRQVELLTELSRFPLLREVSPEHVNSLLRAIHPVKFVAGDIIARQGDAAAELIFIVKGTVDATSDTGLKTEFGAGNVIGLVPIIMGVPHPGTLTVTKEVTGHALLQTDCDRLRRLSPEFDKLVRKLTTERLEHLEKLIAARDENSLQWLRQAERSLMTEAPLPNILQLRQAKEEHRGAPLAIWLGILIDGIPESFVIGASLLTVIQFNMQGLDAVSFVDVVPYTLIAGLFLSNLPEALASSAHMHLLGWSKRRILCLWLSLMIITAGGAGAGFLLADSLSHAWMHFAEGLASGAMLTMIAAAMIPEAVHMGKANAVGLSTLAGFVAAISFKLLE